MDSADLFLQYLRDHSLEEGRTFIQERIAELADHKAIGELLADEALRVLYTPFLSLKLVELLIFFAEYVHHDSSRALGLKAKGDALEQIGHHQAAMEALDAAGEIFLRLGDEGNWARSRISWMTACAWLGRVEEALQEAARAREVFEQLGEYYWVCVIDNNAAVFYDYIGRHQDALKLYENMLAIYPTLTDQSETFIKRSIAIAQSNEAICLSWLGEFEQAYHIQQQAQASFMTLEETSLVVYLESEIANLEYTQGYYGSALRRYYQARDSLIQNNIDNPMLLAELKLWTANCLVKLNRGQEACQLVDEAIELYRQVGTSFQASNALREYATALIAAGRLKEALATLDEAWTLFNRGGFYHHASATKLQQAELLLEMGFFAEAYNQAHLIRGYFEAKGLVSQSVRANLVMVGTLIENVYREKEQRPTHLREATLLCRQTALLARQHNLQEEVYKSYYLLGRIAVLQEDPTKAARYYRAAIAQIERILDDLVYDLSSSFLHTAWIVYEEMIALCLRQGQVERAFGYLEQARSMALRQYLSKSRNPLSSKEQDELASTITVQNSAAVLRTQYELREEQERHRYYSVLLTDIDYSVSPTVNREVIQQEINRCEEKISELAERLYLYQESPRLLFPHKRSKSHKAKQLDVTQLLQPLSPGWMLLAYFLNRGNLVIFAATGEHLVTYELTGGLEQLEYLLPLLHAHLDPRGWPDSHKPSEQVVRGLLKKLYNLLIAPVTELLPSPPAHLTIVPYGPLHQLPFHALYDGSHYLVEKFQVNYLPAASILMHLSATESEQRNRSAEQDIAAKPFLVFGYSGNGHLQRVRDEAKAVASLLNGQCYLEGEATIAGLIEHAPGSPIIHLATHGKSRLDSPNFSYVRLADGQLNAIDAFGLNLEGCELVTLSGCETGLALSGGGDEQLGLGRAFLAAGASSLVMSLWSVEDSATNELMKLFYQNLLKGESKVQALQSAQCSLLHQTGSIYTHPYFWAAFRLVGDTGPLRYARSKS